MNVPVDRLLPFSTRALETSLWPSCCPCGGDGFTLSAWLDACCCQGRAAPCSLPYQPACSHCCFPAGVFVHSWASWSTDPIQVKTNSTKTASDAQSQHKGNTQPKQGEALSPFCSSSTSSCQMKVMTTSDWLASSRTLSKYSSHRFFLRDKPFHCLFPYTNPDTRLEVHNGTGF